MRQFILLTVLSAAIHTYGQTGLFEKGNRFTRQDSLRGSITPERAWWDLLHYDLSIRVDIDDQFISGKNVIRYKVLDAHQTLQIDLQAPMKIVTAEQNGKSLLVRSEGNAHFILLTQKQKPGSILDLTVTFEGKPRAAKNAPWDGGFTWTKDSNGKPFVANSNQGIGASIWWPNKDHGYDEPDNGLLLRITVPQGLVAVGNGRLQETTSAEQGEQTFVWKVINPINNYGVNVNIGDYVNFSEKFAGEKGELNLDYWVLRENEDKAREQFKEVPRTIEAFEHWFGPYPFYEDSYKLVEAPYLGMEHQSSVTYGNGYKNGYNGRNRVSFDWSGTGIGLKWDYIIVHETGHEWFANNITAKDVADMWVHEGFTAYSESLFVEYFFGKEEGSQYTIGTRQRLSNSEPIIGTYYVNKEGSSDMYFKGNNLLHTLRQVIANDDLWRSILRGLNEEFFHQTVTTTQVEKYIADKAGINLTSFFDQYLRDHRVPVLEFKMNDGKIAYRWANVIETFDMPIDVTIDSSSVRLTPTIEWKTIAGESFMPDINYYILVQEEN
jgi:aminopeptidase N